MRYTLHGSLTSPFVRKACCVFDEKEIPYRLQVIDVFSPPDYFAAISPLRRIPVLTFDDRSDLAPLPDSSAICAFAEALRPDPPLLAADPYDRARALWIEEFSDTNFAYRLGFSVTRPTLYPGDAPVDRAKIDREVAEKLAPLLAYLEAQIAGRLWFVGNRFSLADVAVSTQLAGLIHCRRLDILEAYPGLAALLDRAMERPALARIVEQGARFLAERQAAAPADGAGV